ncbi:MarR family winged helix-turn-helix transcriptional regulator [Streptococcus cuniculi]|uniref:MarR family transcriptional regulator n=1 Tax=Streptococcus cuniculi TaxID=1432788 RepID=A0A4Y9JFY9_9STRE|nr:MarR family winged helix-turn-helix transcriptional regulator [Streptococcus cuniculi]MBF0777156.1 winged helix-turn-helix transcriptional regulator [Streptococcus cuniculi]TFU98765.1 MarR family transcriptional regulator [Streptococcus cuniculi]
MTTDLLKEFNRLAHNMGSVVHSAARDADMELLGGPQGHVLYYLAHHEDEEIFIKDIEHHLKISKSVTSNLIKRMGKNGFIVVEPSKRDKRKKIVRMSDTARIKSQKIGKFWGDMRQKLLAGIAEEDLAVFSKVIQQLHHNLEKIEQKEKE